MKKAVLLGVLAAVMLFGIVGLAVADTSALYTGVTTVSNTTPVTARATVNPKITLSIETPDAGQFVEFGTVDPGATASQDVTLTVSSNKVWRLDETTAGDTLELGLTTTLLDSAAGTYPYAKGKDTEHVDTFSIDIPWSTEPGTYTATKLYTLTQEP